MIDEHQEFYLTGRRVADTDSAPVRNEDDTGG